MTRPLEIAVVGSGIAGNVVAHRLHVAGHRITMFEADDRLGGHTHTHRIELDGELHDVDSGFIVFNDRTYPRFVALLDELGVPSQPSTMSFSVRDDARRLEYNGTSWNGLFAQRRNLVRPRFLGMLAQIARFHRVAPAWLEGDAAETTLGELLESRRFGGAFVEDYLVPMGAAIWSTEPARMLDFPARFFVRFLHQHGMLTVSDRPVWRVICGGSSRYLERLVAPWRDRVRLKSAVERIRRTPEAVELQARGHPAATFDHVFIACHADQALAMLADPSREERDILGAFAYRNNDATLHTDTSLLPRTRRAWAAWNYHVLPGPSRGVALTYNMNMLQSLRARQTVCVSLNADDRIDARRVLKRTTYSHPLFTIGSVAAQQRHAEISGVRRTHYCGAYWRYGFHEDGVVSAGMALQRFEATAEQHAERDLSRVA